jgi:hypothetical protein
MLKKKIQDFRFDSLVSDVGLIYLSLNKEKILAVVKKYLGFIKSKGYLERVE